MEPRNAETAPDGEITFIGTATTLIRCGGLTVLTDPNFLHRGQFAYLGHGLVSRRRTEPAMQPADLPLLDAVVLSHLHGDHWDRRARTGLNTSVPIVTTTHAETKLRAQGFRNTVGLHTWEAHGLASNGTSVRVTATPARHARGPAQALLPPVNGHLIEFGTAEAQRPYRIWQSGDSLLIDELATITERLPPVDVAILHLGGTKILGLLLVTMDAAQGIGAVRLVRPAHTLPVHNDDYGVFRSPLSAFRAAVRSADLPTTVHYLDRGESWRFQPAR